MFKTDAALLQAQPSKRVVQRRYRGMLDLLKPIQAAGFVGNHLVSKAGARQLLLVFRGDGENLLFFGGDSQACAHDGIVSGEQQHAAGQRTDNRVELMLLQSVGNSLAAFWIVM